MVQALREIISSADFNHASLIEAFSRFRCPYAETEGADVLSFLKEKAIAFEKRGEARTYLWMNDEKWKQGKAQIDGFFSLSIKVIYFADVSDAAILETVNKSNNHPAFLIGQLARSEESPRGTGDAMLKTAVGFLLSASNIIGCRLAYIDCSESLRDYYRKEGFSFLQKKPKSHLIQMYRLL